eukprot:2687764-Ditylum_brightwellii.AAC.2
MPELILEGNYRNKVIDALTSKLLEHYKKEQDSIELGETISIHEWKEQIRIWNKKLPRLHQDSILVTLKLSKVKVQIIQHQIKGKN